MPVLGEVHDVKSACGMMNSTPVSETTLPATSSPSTPLHGLSKHYGSISSAPLQHYVKEGCEHDQENCKHIDGDHQNDDDDDNDDEFWRGYSQYSPSDFDVAVDVHRGYRATQLRFFSWRRPHMRAFHASWMIYFMNFMLQFSMAPLMVPISETLGLTKAQVWNSNICMMLGGIPMRFMLGPLCDHYGARTIMTLVLAACSIPGIMSFCIVNVTTLMVTRFVLGAMDTFVPGQYWITCHFVRDSVGSTAMAMSGGLGASGSALAQLLLGSCLYPLFLTWTNSVNVAWRLALAIPSVFALAVANYFYHNSDDTSLGNMSQIPELVLERSAVDSFRRGILNVNSWILLVQYAACCGVDFTMCNGAALYYHARYPNLSVASTAAIAGLYSLAALYARGVGGYLSDTLSSRSGARNSIRARLWAQLACLLIQGILNIILARTDSSLSLNLTTLVIFSIFVQMSMGTCFGIVPYVDRLNTGSVSSSMVLSTLDPTYFTFSNSTFFSLIPVVSPSCRLIGRFSGGRSSRCRRQCGRGSLCTCLYLV